MPERPTGTVTFLFTDIEGSTRLLGAPPRLMDRAHRPPGGLLRAAIAAHGGYVYKRSATPSRPRFRPRPPPWPPPSPPSAPSPPNPGPPPRPAARAHGPAHRHHRGARRRLRRARCSTAWPACWPPGTAARSCSPPPPMSWCATRCRPAWTLRDLGERRLKDLIRPEHVWQVVAARPARRVPPAQDAGHAAPTTCPASPPRSSAASTELAAVAALLRRPDTAPGHADRAGRHGQDPPGPAGRPPTCWTSSPTASGSSTWPR